jgi:hypothetical protein
MKLYDGKNTNKRRLQQLESAIRYTKTEKVSPTYG